MVVNAIGLAFLVALGAPAGAFFLRWMVSGMRYASSRWMVVGGFYATLGLAFLIGSATAPEPHWIAGVMSCFLLMFGPILALILLVIGPFRPAPADPPGFEVVAHRHATPGEMDAGTTNNSLQR